MSDELLRDKGHGLPVEGKLMLLRVQLFTAMQTLRGEELEEFWALIDDVNLSRDLHRPSKLEAIPLLDSQGFLVGARVRKIGTDEAWDFGNFDGSGHPVGG